MKDEEIMEILADWNFWEKEQDVEIKREKYLNLIKPFLKTNQAIAITGVRRSGKSTIMMQIAKMLIDSKINPKDILIVNLEDYRFYDFSLRLLQQIYELYLRKVAKGKRRFIFLDEIHRIKGWERFARTLIDKKERVFVSGSNSKLISKELGTLLTGRHISFVILPLTFIEFLKFKKLELKDEISIFTKKIKIKQLLDEFLHYGSFPEVILADEKARKKILIDYLESIINRDIVDRYKIKEKQKLMALVRFYLSNISSSISFNKLKNHLNFPLRTVERFSHYLEEVYLVYFLKRFSFKIKEQEKSQRKIYTADIGLANAYGFQFSKNIGKIMENVVFLELLKKQQDIEIYYWKSPQNEEVDFIIKQGLKVKQLIQACYNLDDIKVKEREIRALLKASKELKCKNLLIITEDKEGEEKVNWFGIKRKIKFIPLLKWLLEK